MAHISEMHKREAEKRRAEIYRLMSLNPGITSREIAANVNLNVWTVRGHIRAIKAGWKPEGV